MASEFPITRQKVSAAMRKSGLKASKWERNGMIRGWGESSPGVAVRDCGETIRISWKSGHYGKDDPKDLDRICAALDASKIPYTRKTDYALVVK